MKLLLWHFFGAVLCCAIFLTAPLFNDVQAQSCSGVITCGGWQTQCRDSSNRSCICGTVGCGAPQTTCISTQGIDETVWCNQMANQSSCSAANSTCLALNGCEISGFCSWDSGEPPPATCPNGFCGAGETCSNCALDCGTCAPCGGGGHKLL